MTALLPRTSASARLRAALRTDATRTGVEDTRSRVGALVGVEHEFVVRLDGRQIDFRQVIHRLEIPGRQIDAADPNAYRGAWGGSITADGPEAEIATPPVTVGPMVGARVASIAAAGASVLRGALPPGATLEGYSTHLSVQVPRGCEGRAALHLAERFAPALTWLLDGPGSPGLLVRPRPGRLELGGDYVDDERLELAAVFAIGAVRAAVRSTSRSARFACAIGLGWLVAPAPPRLAVTPSPAVARYGWFIGDAELGTAFHQHGAPTNLPLATAGAMTFAEHLRRTWAAVLAELGDVDRETIARLAALVSAAPSWPMPESPAASRPAVDAEMDPSVRAWVAANREQVRPGFIATPILMSWDFVVLRLRGGGRDAIVSLSRDVLGGALTALESGRLDALLGGYLASSPDDGRLLASSDQTAAPGLFRGFAKGANLVMPERQPDGGGKDRQRDDQRSDQSSNATSAQVAAAAAASPGPGATDVARTGASSVALPAVTAASAAGTARSRPPTAAVAAVAGVVVLALIGGAVVIGGGGGASSQTQGPGTSAVAQASVSAEPTDAGESEPSREPPPYTTGTATIRLTGGNVGLEVLEFGLDLLPGYVVVDGQTYASLGWNGEISQSGHSRAFFRLSTFEPHATGQFSAALGTLGIEMVFTQVTLRATAISDVVFREGLGDEPNPFGDPTAPKPSCTATIVATPTGGISGTFTCPNISDSGQLAISAEGEFSAEY